MSNCARINEEIRVRIMREVISFIIHISFVEFVGLENSTGGNCSPLLTDLYLSACEFLSLKGIYVMKTGFA